jgi:hypothetical protein
LKALVVRIDVVSSSLHGSEGPSSRASHGIAAVIQWVIRSA